MTVGRRPTGAVDGSGGGGSCRARRGSGWVVAAAERAPGWAGAGWVGNGLEWGAGWGGAGSRRAPA